MIVLRPRRGHRDSRPWDEVQQLGNAIESLLDPEYTNLAGGDEAGPGLVSRRRRQADRHHQRRQPEPRRRPGAGPRRRPTPASASTWCRSAIGSRAEVVVEKVTLPADVRRGQPFDLRVVRQQHGRAGGRAKRARSAAGCASSHAAPSDQPVELSSEHVDAAAGQERVHRAPGDRRSPNSTPTRRASCPTTRPTTRCRRTTGPRPSRTSAAGGRCC